MTLINYTNLQDGEKVTANIFNTRYGQIISVLNGGLGADNFAAGGVPASALADDVFERIYPVGSLYFNATDNTNPAELLGFGTWVAFAAGKVPVGYDSTDTDFNAAEKTGGSKTTTLTEAQLPSHVHSVDPPVTNTGGQSANHTHLVSNKEMTYAAGSAPLYRSIGSLNSSNTDYWEENRTDGASVDHYHSVNIAAFNSAAAGSGSAHSNMNPFITVYIWKRTA